MRRKISFAIAVLTVAALAAASSVQARPDTSFGVDGAANVEPPLPSGWTQNPGAIALSSAGEAYVSSRQNYCQRTGCVGGSFLFRFQADGQLDPAFGGSRGYELPNESYESHLLAVDSAGRPILARVIGSEGSQALVVRRLLRTGQPDPTFAAAGAVSLPCTCGYENTRLMTGREGKVFVVVPRSNAQVPGVGSVPGLTLIALDGSGHRLQGFGTRGVSSMSLPGTEESTYAASAPKGALYFGGRSTGSPAFDSWLARVSVKGKLDIEFTKKAQKSLRLLMGIAGVPGKVNAAVVTHKGKIELFGTAGSVGGFELRLLANGKLDPSFGERGLRIYPWSIVSAIRGSEGATMALTGEEVGTPRLLRILGSGATDPKFGRSGELLPATATKNGLVLEPGGKGAVTVVDYGLHECRISCQSTPRLYRFLEK